MWKLLAATSVAMLVAAPSSLACDMHGGYSGFGGFGMNHYYAPPSHAAMADDDAEGEGSDEDAAEPAAGLPSPPPGPRPVFSTAAMDAAAAARERQAATLRPADAPQ